MQTLTSRGSIEPLPLVLGDVLTRRMNLLDLSLLSGSEGDVHGPERFVNVGRGRCLDQSLSATTMASSARRTIWLISSMVFGGCEFGRP